MLFWRNREEDACAGAGRRRPHSGGPPEQDAGPANPPGAPEDRCGSGQSDSQGGRPWRRPRRRRQAVGAVITAGASGPLQRPGHKRQWNILRGTGQARPRGRLGTDVPVTRLPHGRRGRKGGGAVPFVFRIRWRDQPRRTNEDEDEDHSPSGATRFLHLALRHITRTTVGNAGSLFSIKRLTRPASSITNV